MLHYSVGVGLGVMRVRVSGRCFVALLARRVFIRIKGTCEFHLGSVAVAWAVPGGFNVASRWGCVQGVWEQCRCWSLGMGGRVSNVGWGITKVAAQNCAHYLVVRNGVVEVCVRVWYGMVDVCDGYLAAEASGSSFG